MSNRILVVDDEPSARKVLRRFLMGEGYTVVEAHCGEEAVAAYRREKPDVVLLDIRMPGQNGLDVLRVINRRAPDAVVIMTTAVDEVSTAVEAMKLGAYDYLVKPIDPDRLSAVVERARERVALKQEVERLRILNQEWFANEEAVVASPVMEDIFEHVKILGQAEKAIVLITGETGTGKEIVARAIHLSSPRADQPLVVVNCGAIPKELMEAELLGYARGAFTGASKDGKKGKVELADHGTLLLDEVGELPWGAQTVLLRILDGQPFYPVGSNREVDVDVRVITATNRDLEAAVAEGSFREDLFYRINVASIHLPPLRDRPEDIVPLATHFLDEFNHLYGKTFRGFTPEAVQGLKAFRWRGNVRELKNAIERVVLYEDAIEVQPEHLAFLEAGSAEKGSPFGLSREDGGLEGAMKDLIVEALKRGNGNKSEASRLLGISRSTFQTMVRKYGLNAL